jgi:Zn-finger protein
MDNLAELLKRGCCFCKCPLTPETAYVGVVVVSLTGTDVWNTPAVAITCKACAEKYKVEE